MTKILLFCPAYERGGIDMFWPDSLDSFAAILPPPGVEVVRWIGRDNPHAVGHKNVLHQFQQARKRALDEGFDALCTFECDMIVPPDGLTKLWNTDAGIAYGLYVLRHGSLVVNAFRYIEGAPNIDQSLTLFPDLFAQSEKRGWARVSGCGNGFTLIRRTVLERFEMRPTGESYAPDWGLATDAQRAGIVQICRFDVPCGHIEDNGMVYWPFQESYLTARVRVNVSFSGNDGSNTRPFKQGEVCTISRAQAAQFERAGFVTILDSVKTHMTSARARAPMAQAPASSEAPARPVVITAPSVQRSGTAALIVNYNMPERADALAEYIKTNCQDVEVILIDNGSDLTEPAKNTALRLAQNVQTTNGWLMGLHYLDAISQVRGVHPEFYWFLITSAEFTTGDPLSAMIGVMRSDPSAVGVHPAVDAEGPFAWKHLLPHGDGGARRTWMIDNISALYRADWFDSIGRFDASLTYAWGIDLETGYLARREGRALYVCEDVHVKKVTDIGYSMDRMNMSASDRRKKAEANMQAVLSEKYGPKWREALWDSHIQAAKNGMVSVIIPTYNRPDLLPRALESVKNQTYTNLEALVINDGGVDVCEIVSRYPFARCITHDKNKGLPAARNTGIRASRGQYIAYLDDDDWYYKNHLEMLVNGIQNHRAAYTNAHAVDREEPNGRYIFTNEYSPQGILKQNLFPCNTVLHERSLVDEAGWFDESLPNCEDWDMWIRIAKITPWHHVPVITCAVDRTRPTMSSNREAMIATFEKIRARYANGQDYRPGNLKPGISGCVRVRNDAEFLRPAVISHLPYCDEIVLAVQPSEDDTEKIADELAQEFPQVRVEKYPLVPVYINDPEWATIPEDDPRSFVYLSNWALSKCRHEWVMKFEADVIAVASLAPIVEKIRSGQAERKYYGRVVLNVAGPEYKLINATVPCNGGWDEGIFPNSPEYKFVRAGKYETIDHTISAHECIGWAGLHLKHAKRRYWGKIKEQFAPFDKVNLRGVMGDWLKSHQWPAKDDPLGETCLFDDGWREYCPPWSADGK